MRPMDVNLLVNWEWIHRPKTQKEREEEKAAKEKLAKMKKENN